jgi:tape measure domain-containing protein
VADDVSIWVRLLGATRARRDAMSIAGGVRQIGTDARLTSGAVRKMGGAIDSSSRGAARGIDALAQRAHYGAIGLGALGVAGVKMGLTFNAQVESARLRFKLFTTDVDGLTKAVQHIDLRSAFNFGDLADAAAMLGNSGVRDIPNVLQAAANAAAASGKGLPALQGIVIALSQIQAKGRLSQEEINQLNEAGAPGAQKIIQRAFGLTSKEVGNLGGQGLSATKAVQALTKAWTSGPMARAAADQTRTLGGQWALLTGNIEKATGAITLGLAGSLERDVLPAANRAATAVGLIFRDQNIAPEEKLRRARAVIDRELGPFANDLKDAIDRANIPQHLGELIGKALPEMAKAAAAGAPHVATAFVDAWLHSGPMAQLISLLYLRGKFGGGGRGGGGLGGALGGAGGILGMGRSLKPIPVWVVNQRGGGGTEEFLKRYGPGGGAAAAARAAGGVAAVGAAGFESGRAIGTAVDRATGRNTNQGNWLADQPLFRFLFPALRRHSMSAAPNPYSATSAQQGLRNPTQLLGGIPLYLDQRISLDGQQIERNRQRVVAKRRARRAGG